MTRHALARSIAILSLLLVGACATGGDGGYPDLGPRAIEGRLDTVPPATPDLPPPPPPAAELSARIGQLVAQAKSADAAFQASLEEARAAVAKARGAAVSSEAWVAAQTALSALEADGALATDALADLDALVIGHADASRRDGATELAAAQALVAAIVTDQRNTLQALLAGLNPA